MPTIKQKLLIILKDYGITHWERPNRYGTPETVIELTLDDLEDIVLDMLDHSPAIKRVPVIEASPVRASCPASVASPVAEDSGSAVVVEGTAVPDGKQPDIAALEEKLQRFDEELLDQEAEWSSAEDLGVSVLADSFFESDYIREHRPREPLVVGTE